MRAATEQEVKGLRPILCDLNVVGELVTAQRKNRQFHILGAIVDQQNLNFVRHELPHS